MGNQSTEQQALDRKSCIDRHTAIHNSLWSDYRNMQLEQTRNAIEMSKISPFGLFRFLGDKTSGNGYHGYAAFWNQVKNYQLTYRDYITAKDLADPESRHIFWNEGAFFFENFMSKQQVDPADIPQFAMKSATFGEIAANSLGDMAILLFWVIGLFAAVFVAFIRYDVR